MENQNNNRGNGGNNNQNPKRPSFLSIVMAILISLVMGAMFWSLFMGDGGNVEEVTYSEFIAHLESGKVDEVELNNERISYTLKEEENTGNNAFYPFYFRMSPTVYSAVLIEEYDTVTQRLMEANVPSYGGVSTSMSDLIINMLLTVVLPLILMLAPILASSEQ